MPADCLAMHAQLAGNLARRPTVGRQRGNGMLQAHVELIHRALVWLPPHSTQCSPQVAGFDLPIPGRFSPPADSTK